MNTSHSFPKSARLLSHRDYRIVAKHGKEREGAFLAIKVYLGKPCGPKLGISVSRRFGKSVQRNRFKRQLREAFRLNREKFSPNLQLNVRPRQKMQSVKFQEIEKELVELLLTP